MKSILPVSTALAVLVTAGMFVLKPAAAQPGKAVKKIIVCTVTTGFRHPSIPSAEATLKQLGEENGDYVVADWVQQPTAPRAPKKPGNLRPDADDKAKTRHAEEMKKYEADLAAWTPEKEAASNAEWDAQMIAGMEKLSPENLRKAGIDAVIFANTTGDLPLPDREGFIKWVEEGHAFMAMHSGSDTFHGFTGYLDMIQGEFAGHGDQVPASLVAGDQEHPANGGLGEKWDIKQEEMYLIRHHDRTQLRSLWHMRHHPNEPQNEGYYPVSWCRAAGKGRVFYTSLGHRQDLWSADPNLKNRINPVETSKQFQAHLLGGIRWALGLAAGSSEPNPAVQ
ncbi:MAG: ThuA domain-containing protein [Verrucomicrobiales bacterium]